MNTQHQVEHRNHTNTASLPVPARRGEARRGKAIHHAAAGGGGEAAAAAAGAEAEAEATKAETQDGSGAEAGAGA